MTTHPWSSDSATPCQSDQLSLAAKMPKNLANTQKHFPRAFLKKQGGTGHVSMFLGHSGSFHTLCSDPSWRLKDEDFGWMVCQTIASQKLPSSRLAALASLGHGRGRGAQSQLGWASSSLPDQQIKDLHIKVAHKFCAKNLGMQCPFLAHLQRGHVGAKMDQSKEAA